MPRCFLLPLLFCAACDQPFLTVYVDEPVDDTPEVERPDAEPPVADAGPDLSGPVGTEVTFDGSDSSDPGGFEPLSFSWSIVQAPTGSTATLDAANTARPRFTPDVAGSFVVELSVDNVQGVSAASPDSATLTATEVVIEPPEADAGPDQTVSVGDTVFVDGTESTDPAGLEPLVYDWRLIAKPAGSAMTLATPAAESWSFVADEVGAFAFELAVQNSAGIWDATPDPVAILVQAAQAIPPVAHAGADQLVSVGDLVTLDATGSSDPQGQSLTYHWTLQSWPSGSAVLLSSAQDTRPQFTADQAGAYVVSLAVQNSSGVWDPTPDSVTVTAQPAGAQAPVANAGPDQAVFTGTTVALDGSASQDPGGNLPLVYSWTLTSKPSASTTTLSGASSPTPSLYADQAGSYVVHLAVQNSAGVWDATPDEVVIEAQTVVAGEPLSDAGPDQVVNEGAFVTLDGAGSSDPGGSTPLTYSWTFTAMPSSSTALLSDPAAQAPTFTADLAGTYLVELVVRNSLGIWDSTPDGVEVTAQAALAPVAHAGPDQAVLTGSLVALDGSASTDPQGLTPLTYVWLWTSRPSGSTAALSDPISMSPTFTADLAGTYVLTLSVGNTAGTWDPTPDTMQVVAGASAPEPIADPGPDLNSQSGNWITLDGRGSSDPSGLTPLTYAWQFTNWPTGSLAQLSDPAGEAPTFYADLPGTYALQLSVQNSAGVWDSSPEYVLVTVYDAYARVPVPDAGPDRAVELGLVAALDGSASYDPQSADPLTFSWAITQAPAGSAAALIDAATATPSLTPDVAGSYRLQLDVTSAQGVSAAGVDEVVLTAVTPDPSAPISSAGVNTQLAPLTVVQLHGGGSYDPGGTALTYDWRLLAAPENSGAELDDPSSIQPLFFADLAGVYIFELAVQNQSGTWDPTPDQLVIRAVPTESLYVELSWDSSSDLDLHLLDGSTGLFGPGDATYCNPAPEWGQSGIADNPELKWYEVYGYGPEVISIPSPAAGSYEIVAHYYGTNGFPSCTGACPSSRATVRIYADGVLVRSDARTLHDRAQSWRAASIDWPSTTVTVLDSMSSNSLTTCW